MKWKISVVVIIMLAILTACSGGQEREEMVPQFLDVQLTVNPEQGNVNEPVTFEAKVTYGDKEVTDPNEIDFEIWRANDENHETFIPEHVGNGVFKLEKTFTEEGTYYVFSHVTAENMHNMPKKEFVIGTPSDPEDSITSTIME
ncbi:FixH family protein [Bacillus tuaregi]|uniref:FixH family protein n=1 Tax=Bacillus tuaregi TaxID=1816695 RepID=UPI0008F8FBEC|nr:FixH family protein [Bacillus tuaregi]